MKWLGLPLRLKNITVTDKKDQGLCNDTFPPSPHSSFPTDMGAGRRALGPCCRNHLRRSVPQAEENKPPVSYGGTEAPLILLRQMYYLASSHASYKCCTDVPSIR